VVDTNFLEQENVVQQKGEQQIVDDSKKVSEIADLMGAGMPRVESYVAETVTPPIEARYIGKIDRFGVQFDPERHEVDGNGDPVMTRRGNWRRKPGRPSRDGQPPKPAVNIPAVEEIPPEQQAKLKSLATRQTCAVVAVSSIETITVGIFGQEWALNKNEKTGIDEKEYLTGAFSEYLETKGDIDLPPGLTLVLALGIVYGPKLTQEKSLTKLQRFKNWCLEKWFAFKNRRKPGPVKPVEMPVIHDA
jgi:hypothetical protein